MRTLNGRLVVVASLSSLSGVLALAASACVGDEAAVGSPSPDAATGLDSTTPVNDAAVITDSGGGDAGCKPCNGQCVSPQDPAYGCTATSCSPCAAKAHTTSQKCAAEACVIDTCDVAYDDLDRDASNGCETPNPRAFQPGSLALWLRADNGVTVSDGGVASWKNQSGAADAGIGAVLATGTPTLDTTLWPTNPGAPSVKFAAGDSFAVDLHGMMGSAQTTFVVSARYGDAVNCLLGSNTAPAASCCANAGQAFQICYASSTTVNAEVFCNNQTMGVAANTSSGYQANLIKMWFDGAVNYTSTSNGTSRDTTGQCPAALTNLTAPGRLGGGYGGPGYTGLFAELVVYSTLLSAPDTAAVDAYLRTKWKLP